LETLKKYHAFRDGFVQKRLLTTQMEI